MPRPSRWIALFAAAVFALAFAARGQGLAISQSPLIEKIDPPNWFAALPRPMLLVRGQHLQHTTFTLSDPALALEHTEISANGHWAQLWLGASPVHPETIRIRAQSPAGTAEAPYTFAPRRAQGPAGFSAKDVMYLIMPDRFANADPANDALPGSPAADRHDPHRFHGGDLRGITAHLDYLQGLGVTALWLTPIVQNDPRTSDYHGYGATDLYAVEPRLGTLADYQALAAALHRRGMKLVFDDVPNHTGPAHPWVLDPPASDWLHGTAAQHLENKYVFGPVSDPNAAPAASRDALDGWFVNILADLNQDSPAVTQYLTDNMIWWIEEVGIDALRIDTFPYVPRTFWQRYLGTLTALYPQLTEVGEVSTPDASLNAFFAGGRTVLGADTHLTTPFDYPLYGMLIETLAKGKPMSALEETLRQDWLYPHPEVLVPFLGNHDQKRFLSQPGFAPGTAPAVLRMGLGLLMTLRGTPQLYYGDEILMEGGDDPDDRHDFPGGFAGDPRNAFTPAGRTPAQNAMHDWLAGLGKLRAASPALTSGRMQSVLVTDNTFAFLRTTAPAAGGACTAAGSRLMALNRSTAPATLTIPVAGSALAGCHSATFRFGDGSAASRVAVGDSVSIPLPAFGFAAFDLQ